MKDVLVIIPVYNESQNIERVERDLKLHFPEADRLYINDHSEDDTLEKIRGFKESKYLDLSSNLGYFFAIQSGLKYAAQEGYQYVVQFDGDGQHLAAEARRLYETALKQKTDVLIGTRYFKDSAYKNSTARAMGTALIRWLYRRLTGKKLSDPTSGLQVLSAKAITYLSQTYNYPETADANLLMELYFKGFIIEEHPVVMRERDQGESMHSGIIGPVKYMGKMLYYMTFVFLERILGVDNG